MRVLVGLASFGIAKNITMNLYEDDSYKSIIPEPKNESHYTNPCERVAFFSVVSRQGGVCG